MKSGETVEAGKSSQTFTKSRKPSSIAFPTDQSLSVYRVPSSFPQQSYSFEQTSSPINNSTRVVGEKLTDPKKIQEVLALFEHVAEHIRKEQAQKVQNRKKSNGNAIFLPPLPSPDASTQRVTPLSEAPSLPLPQFASRRNPKRKYFTAPQSSITFPDRDRVKSEYVTSTEGASSEEAKKVPATIHSESMTTRLLPKNNLTLQRRQIHSRPVSSDVTTFYKKTKESVHSTKNNTPATSLPSQNELFFYKEPATRSKATHFRGGDYRRPQPFREKVREDGAKALDVRMEEELGNTNVPLVPKEIPGISIGMMVDESIEMNWGKNSLRGAINTGYDATKDTYVVSTNPKDDRGLQHICFQMYRPMRTELQSNVGLPFFIVGVDQDSMESDPARETRIVDFFVQRAKRHNASLFVEYVNRGGNRANLPHLPKDFMPDMKELQAYYAK